MTLRSSATGSARPSCRTVSPAEVDRLAQCAEGVAAGVAVHEQHRRGRSPAPGRRRAPRLGRPRRDDRQRGARDDREIARFERLERRHPRLQDADPADLPFGAFGGELGGARRAGRREQRAMEIVEGRQRPSGTG